MLSYKPWSPDSLLRLLLFLFTALSGAGLLGAAADRYWAAVPEETRRFWVSFGSGALMQVLGLVLMARFVGENRMSWREGFGLRFEESPRMLLVGVVAAVVGLALAMGILLGSQWLMALANVTPVEQSSITALRQSEDVARRLAVALTTVLLAPLFEELLFRGILYPALKQAGYPRFALWGTAVLFGLSHVNLLTFASLTCFGLLLTVLYERTDNLLAPITAHACFNAVNYAWVVLGQSAG